MKIRKIWLVLAAILLILCACGPNDAPQEPQASGTHTEDLPADRQPSSNAPDSPDSVSDPSLPPREGMVRSPLTNEWVDPETAQTRPLAVLIPNEEGAIPQYNLSEASVLYETNVENRVSRLMAIFEDWQNLPVIGNIRSLRTYFAYWAFEWDAFIVHSGGPYFVDDLLAEPTTENINDHNGADSSAFYRDSRKPQPHNLYVNGQDVLEVVKKKGYSLTYRGLTDGAHFCFADAGEPNDLTQYGSDAKSAVYIDMSGCYPLTRCYFEYNDEDGLYYRSQHLSGGTDGPHIDGATGRQLSFKNILVQYVTYEELANGYLVFQCHDNAQDGWFFTNGRGIHVTWEKGKDYDATRYYDDSGKEVVFNTGKTMICVVLDGDSFTFR